MKLGIKHFKLLLFLILLFSITASISQASELLEICPNPYGSDDAEYVKLFVNTPCTLTDGEGAIKINKSGIVFVAKNSSAFYDEFGIKADYEFPKRFALSNNGESVILIENNSLVDEFYYSKASEGLVYFKRNGSWTFKYQDWSDFDTVKDFVKGRIIITPCSYNFRCNEDALIASYTFTNVELLKNLNNVEIFVDATPTGGVPVEEMEISRICKVSFLKANSYKNFHYKFGLCGNKVVITTENWVWHNRGYIVEFESEKVARFLKNVLYHDKKYESSPGKVSKLSFAKNGYANGKEFDFEGYIEVFVIPDRNPILEIMSSSNQRLYIQTPYINFGFYNKTPILDSIKKSAKNAEVKVLLDSRYNKEENIKTAEFLNRIAKIYGLNIEARLVNPNHFDSLHGKMVISDDKVVITSANFNMYGFKLNREIGVVIYNKEVSDFLAEQFLEDFGYEKKMDYTSLFPFIALMVIALFIVVKALRRF